MRLVVRRHQILASRDSQSSSVRRNTRTCSCRPNKKGRRKLRGNETESAGNLAEGSSPDTFQMLTSILFR